jgi:hypothetical protein
VLYGHITSRRDSVFKIDAANILAAPQRRGVKGIILPGGVCCAPP